MEPKRSMSAYAGVVVLALLALALSGFAVAAECSAIGLLLAGALLWGERTRLLRNGRRVGRPSPPQRRSLDRLVLAQWIGAGLLSLVPILAIRYFSLDWLSSVGRFEKILVATVTIASLGVFLSSLFDWTVILPKVSGLSGPAPCECPGGERWKYTTCFWYFHRTVATALIYVLVIGVFAVAGAGSSGSARVYCSIAAGLAAVLGGYFFRAMFIAGWYAFNPPILVGDPIYVQAPEEGDGDVRVVRRRAYVLDVSLQGAKYKILEDGRYRGGRFTNKSDGTVSNRHLAKELRPPGAAAEPPICPKGGCTGINWYCRHNPRAHD